MVIISTLKVTLCIFELTDLVSCASNLGIASLEVN